MRRTLQPRPARGSAWRNGSASRFDRWALSPAGTLVAAAVCFVVLGLSTTWDRAALVMAATVPIAAAGHGYRHLRARRRGPSGG